MKSIIVKISEKQYNGLLDFIRKISIEHGNAGCEPPSYQIILDIGGPYGSSAVAKTGSHSVDLGEIEVEMPIKYSLA